MLIGLISDTHLARPEEELPFQIHTAFKGVELILHAGDIWVPSALDQLESIAPVMAAWGDDDMESDLGNDPRMLNERSVNIDGLTLWLVHEKPAFGTIVPRENRIFSRTTEPEREVPNAVIYGHTHKALIEKHKGVLVINPGSPTWPNNFPELGTVGLLSIESGKIDARIIQLE
jgi:putative phosphoesterase